MKRIFFLLTILISFASTSKAWNNPITLDGEWYQYGIGDPYIMKYKGTFYLYCSTKDNNVGVKCWSSKDLKNWSNAITCSTDPITKSAYAPEVIYWNGMFYMYTSPAGHGHFVLSSTSPTGPFTAVSANVGKSIDGSVFINDDGKWYFYRADGAGIMGSIMPTPTTIGADVNLHAQMANNWTEGPCVFKRNGTLYLIYTGNHVISKGYRVDYAKSTSGPLSSFTPQAAQNPILVKSEGSIVGLGHGTAFIGPDLDSYFITYHNLAGDYGVGPYRRLNFDRIAWNGDKMLLLGPTSWAQEAPQQPDFVDYFERHEIETNWDTIGGGNWTIKNQEMLVQDSSDDTEEIFHKIISKTSTASDYTAEFTIKEESRSNDQARTGIVFAYTDESNYGMAVFHSITNQLEISFKINNVWGNTRKLTLPAGYNYNVWHSIRIEKHETSYKFFVDGMLKSTMSTTLGAGKIGYMTSWSKGDFGYIAYSNKVQGSGIFDTFKPVPGKIEAVHYNSGAEGVAYHDLSPGNLGERYIRKDNVDIIDCSEGGFAISNNQVGEWYKYNINVQATRTFNLGLKYAASGSDSKIRIWQGDTDLTGVISLPSTTSSTTWQVYTIKGLNLKAGFQTLKFEIVAGDFDFYNFELALADNTIFTKTDDFTKNFSFDWNYSDGTWSIVSGQAKVSGFAKKTFGSTAWSDYTLQTDITYTDAMNSGLIFRVNNPALGGAGNNPEQGTDFYQGYYVTLNGNSVVLGKQNYSWTLLKTAAGAYRINTKYTIKVEAIGANIKVYVDDMDIPKIDFTDPNPFIHGKVGLRSFNSTVFFDNFSVTTIDDDSPALVESTMVGKEVKLFPNPVKNSFFLDNVDTYSSLSIYSINGCEIYSTPLSGAQFSLDVAAFDSGLYFMKISNNAGQSVGRKFVKL